MRQLKFIATEGSFSVEIGDASYVESRITLSHGTNTWTVISEKPRWCLDCNFVMPFQSLDGRNI